MLPGDSVDARKARGAFFTPYAIAEFLATWATAGQSSGSYLDPTCGDGVFLVAAAEVLRKRGAELGSQTLYGVDLHAGSINEARLLLESSNVPQQHLFEGDFSEEPTPSDGYSRIPMVDAILGNPPFVRYQDQSSGSRSRAVQNALSQGVSLSRLSSSWASILVHSVSFLKPEGRIAMVLPAELLSVGYAEPIRRWLRSRFRTVHLVLFNRLQFGNVNEQVVLLVAKGSGGCDAFSLHEVDDAQDLKNLHVFDSDAYVPKAAGKWTEMFIPESARKLLPTLTADHFGTLADYGRPELGTVTGANKFFMLSESAREQAGFNDGVEVTRTVPAGTRHLKGMAFSLEDWRQLRKDGERVWMLNPSISRGDSVALERFLSAGELLEVDQGYKCSIRSPWWKIPVQSPPDFFFTYMSHFGPRLVSNKAGTTLVNSMHGIRINEGLEREALAALPYASYNSVTLLNAELTGRAYGGGLLKMEPREAALLSVPSPSALESLSSRILPIIATLEALAREKKWSELIHLIDEIVLVSYFNLAKSDVELISSALTKVRSRRIVKREP